MSLVSKKTPVGKKYWRYDILLTPSKTLWEKYE